MRKPDPRVLEQLEARADISGMAALAAYNRGDRTNGDIFTKEAAEAKQRTERYRQTGSWRATITK